MRIPLTVTNELFWLGENRVPFNFAMMARISGPFSHTDLAYALHRAAERHPLSRARLEIDDSGQGWLTTRDAAEIPVRFISDTINWERVVEDELACPFNPTIGLHVRAVCIASSLPAPSTVDLILVFNHNVCDGMSGAYFTRDVLLLLGDPAAEFTPRELRIEDLANLIPYRAATGRWMRLQLLAIKTLAPIAWIVQKRLPRPIQPEPVPDFSIQTWALTTEKSGALINRCRAERTSVHAAICAAWLIADAEFDQSTRPRSVSTPVNLRNCLSEPIGDRFGLFMASIITRVDCSAGKNFWEIARAIKRQMDHDLAGDRKYSWLLRINAVLRGISAADRRGALALLSGQRPGYDLAISNLGRLDFSTQTGSLSIETLYGPLVNGFPFERTVSVLTFGGVMHFAFTFRKFVLDRHTALCIQARAMELLERASGCMD